jgi:hypothetical protein
MGAASKEKPVAYGILKSSQIKDEIDLKAEELRFYGYCILDSGFTDQELADLRNAIDKSYVTQSKEVEDIGGMEAKRDSDLVLAPIVYDPLFLKSATTSNLMKLSQRVLGENFVLLQQNAIINRPSNKHYQIQWHRDLNYQHFTSSQPLSISALYCVDDFNAETGGTVVLPGTHLIEEFPSDEFVLNKEVQVVAKAGSILVFNSMLFHRAGKNVSQIIRRGLNHVIGRPFLAQQIDLPRVLNGKYKEDPFLSKYLGYRWNPASSVKSWRSMRR